MERFKYLPFLLCCLLVMQCGKKESGDMMNKSRQTDQITASMVEKYGRQHKDRIRKGVTQVVNVWTPADGTPAEMEDWCLANFVDSPAELQASFEKLEHLFEQVNGMLVEMDRDFQWDLQVDTGPIKKVDYLTANLNLAAHLEDDLFKSKIAFWVLLNYPVYSLEDLLADGPKWSRQKWAEARLAGMFTSRVPAAVNQDIHAAYLKADDYISNYNIYMHNLLNDQDERIFPEGMKLISHWGLRDELKARYNTTDGLPQQEMIFSVMQKIITQEIPQIVVNNPETDWKVSTNEVFGKNAENTAEPDTRYLHLLNIFKAEKSADEYYPLYPTFIDRRFNLYREIPEETVENLFRTLLSSNEFRETGKLVAKRLGRALRPFDIWYNGFRNQTVLPEDELTKVVQAEFPDVTAFDEKIPAILQKLGFTEERAAYLGDKITVDPARGAGHAAGAGRRGDQAHLRTRVPESGMDYKGFNIAVHELGHNVEQTFSLYDIDHYFLEGVPNTAFTEAAAFVFQSRDLQILGIDSPAENSDDMAALDQLWSVCEIGGVALVDMKVWRWMYANPAATPAELKAAVIQIAQDVWNEYFAPVFGTKDEIILAVYSHMIDAGLYLPDYPIGHIIQFQIEEYLKDKSLATEMERIYTIGSVTPAYWMQEALGAEISVKPLLKAVKKALKDQN